ncbi:MAG: hypothetical protein PF448_12965 [Bacteroidales bacterium]|jgi:hypothetical protein|nr:hypothetical protein [Bacteroidales bacterium]
MDINYNHVIIFCLLCLVEFTTMVMISQYSKSSTLNLESFRNELKKVPEYRKKLEKRTGFSPAYIYKVLSGERRLSEKNSNIIIEGKKLIEEYETFINTLL